MSQKPVLVIMAAGMGSRYGGLKQIDPVDREGDLIIDFSIFDAVEAGFEKVVFIIKKSIEKEFMENRRSRRSMIVWHPAVMMTNISMRWLPIISTTH